MKRLVLGILAHVDSGKTTLSEGLLFRCGQIRKLGRVDHGDAFLDSNTLERERGITIFSKQAVLPLKSTALYLLDTPGHVDFSTEMERTLQVLDYAILVVSGTDGIQSHTETLWRLLAHYHIPTFLFINKMDLANTTESALMTQLKQRFHESCIDFTAGLLHGSVAEESALCDEILMEQYLETGHLKNEALCQAITARKLFPCFFGSALKLEGLDTLQKGLEDLTCAPQWKETFGAKVFKISTDEQGTRLTHLKITGGHLKVKDLLDGKSREDLPWSEKVNQIRLYSGTKFELLEEALPGMVCAVTGLSLTYPGEGLGAQSPSEAPALQPVLTYRVDLPSDTDTHTALHYLRKLEEEDPQLHVVWNERLQELHIQIMGQVQLEILKSLLMERFKLPVEFGQGTIIYLETIQAPVEGVGHFEPLRHYAEVHLLLEPGERGSGLTFASSCREDELDKNWQRLIMTHLMEKVHIGVLTGAPITDMKITLASGRAHLKHTEGGDFRQATYRALRQGLRQAQSILLEPWYTFRLQIPSENVGRSMSDLQRMDAQFSLPQDLGNDITVLTGCGPVATLRDYSTEVTAYTKGRGQFSCTFQGYAPCHNTAEICEAVAYQCEADLDNPADSVFCAHGAGFTVKWDQVSKHMHLASVLEKSNPQVVSNDTAKAHTFARNAADYCTMLSEDKELMEIFEKTYGPVRRDPRKAFRSVKRESPPDSSYRAKDIPIGPAYLLVDGYNIIFSWEDLKKIAEENIDTARHQLLHLLCNYQGVCNCEVIVVFDAYKIKGNPGSVENFHNIHVVYTKEAETADMYIEKVTHALSREHRVRVATSDGLEQLIILGHGATRLSASSFREEVEQVMAAMREILASSQTRKH